MVIIMPSNVITRAPAFSLLDHIHHHQRRVVGDAPGGTRSPSVFVDTGQTGDAPHVGTVVDMRVASPPPPQRLETHC